MGIYMRVVGQRVNVLSSVAARRGSISSDIFPKHSASRVTEAARAEVASRAEAGQEGQDVPATVVPKPPAGAAPAPGGAWGAAAGAAAATAALLRRRRWAHRPVRAALGVALSSASGRLSSPHLPVTRPAIHNSRVPVANVSYPPGGGLLAVLWHRGGFIGPTMVIARYLV